jgi:hypothetical protein
VRIDVCACIVYVCVVGNVLSASSSNPSSNPSSEGTGPAPDPSRSTHTLQLFKTRSVTERVCDMIGEGGSVVRFCAQPPKSDQAKLRPCPWTLRTMKFAPVIQFNPILIMLRALGTDVLAFVSLVKFFFFFWVFFCQGEHIKSAEKKLEDGPRHWIRPATVMKWAGGYCMLRSDEAR